jgi:hypothetical protein
LFTEIRVKVSMEKGGNYSAFFASLRTMMMLERMPRAILK